MEGRKSLVEKSTDREPSHPGDRVVAAHPSGRLGEERICSPLLHGQRPSVQHCASQSVITWSGDRQKQLSPGASPSAPLYNPQRQRTGWFCCLSKHSCPSQQTTELLLDKGSTHSAISSKNPITPQNPWRIERFHRLQKKKMHELWIEFISANI